MKPQALVNGETADRVSILDRGLQFGDGLFETIAVQNENPLLWERHARRLIAGARRLGIGLAAPVSWQSEVFQLCRGIGQGVLKITVTRGTSERGYSINPNATPTRILSISPWPAYPAANAHDGVAVRVCRTRLGRNPELAGIKHLNRLEQVLARMELNDGFAEGVMCNDANYAIEGTMSNLFLVQAGTVRTPDLSDCGVAGVMRETVLDQLRQLGVAARVEPVTLDELFQADEVFITNSLIGIWPVRRLAKSDQDPGHEFPVGATTKQIQIAIQDRYISGKRA